MENPTTVNGKMANIMVEEHSTSQMIQYTWAHGPMASKKDTESLYPNGPTQILATPSSGFIKEIFQMVKKMGMALKLL